MGRVDMATRAHIRYKGDPKSLKKELRPVVKDVLKEAVSAWHDETLPVHFTDTGRRRYKYRARTHKYRKRKRKTKFHGDPLVFSGALRRQATRRARITGTAKSARATMSVPWYATKRFKGHATYADEMTSVVALEVKKMAIKTSKEITQKLKKKQRNMKGRKR